MGLQPWQATCKCLRRRGRGTLLNREKKEVGRAIVNKESDVENGLEDMGRGKGKLG